MRVMVIEDEQPALHKLLHALQKCDPQMEIVATTGSIRESGDWLAHNPAPDLIFLDIQLSDGLSLEIFRDTPPPCPVIFTTAYDDYIMQAFELNGIDYLLKPIRQERLQQAIHTYKRLKKYFTHDISQLIHQLAPAVTGKRMLVRRGNEWIALEESDIAYLHSEQKVVFITDSSGRQWLTDRSLNAFETELNGKHFFRANRRYLVSLRSVEKFSILEKSRLQLFLKPATREPVIVSQEKADSFKKWLTGRQSG